MKTYYLWGSFDNKVQLLWPSNVADFMHPYADTKDWRIVGKIHLKFCNDSPRFCPDLMPKFYLDLSDDLIWLIKRDLPNGIEERYYAGKDKAVAEALINRLNNSHRPNIYQSGNEFSVCWNNHAKGDKCEYELEIADCGKANYSDPFFKNVLKDVDVTCPPMNPDIKHTT